MPQHQPTEESRFFMALSEGDTAQVKAMVENTPALLSSYDARNFGATPLTAVCFANRPELVDVLLDLGADPNQRSDWKMGPWSPLHCAVYRRDHKLAEHLLKRGAVLDVHTAAGLGWLDPLNKLLERNPERVLERGGDGCYPLHFADTVPVAELLLARGAQIDGRCVDHFSTPLQYLCSCRPDVARFLLSKGATPDIFSVVLCSELTLLERLLANDRSLVEARIDQAFFPPSEDYDVHNILTFSVGLHATPVHAAATGNSARAVAILQSFGANINARGGYDMATPLHLAAWNDCLESAIALVDGGADIDTKSGKIHNNSPAGWAIVAGSLRVFELLVSRNAQTFPWFIDDAKDACGGRFDRVRRVSKDTRNRILAILEEQTLRGH